MYEVNRIAVLIGSQSPGSAYLPGVRHDVRKMKEFLLSPNGGAWHEDEIIVLMNPDCRQVMETITSALADYVFVYFSGHGYTNIWRQRVVALADGPLWDMALLNRSPRQLIMADACRVHEEGGATIGAIPWNREKWLHADGYSSARALFNQYIMDSPAGRMIVHAAQDNQPAFEDHYRKGGRFTLSLLDNVFLRQEKGRYGPCYIREVINEVTPQMTSFIQPQEPEIVFEEGFLRVPLALTSHNFIPSKPRVIRQVPVQQHSNAGGLLLLAGLVWAIYEISNK